MGHSSAVGFLAFALLFVACVVEIATAADEKEQAPEITDADVQQAVDAAQNSIKRVSENAQNNLTSTRRVLQKVESSKKKAEKAAVDAEQEATDNNAKAKVIVDNIKTISTRVTELHDSVKGKLDSTVSSLDKVVSEADKLKEQCNTVLPLDKAVSQNYAGAKAKALEIKGNADKLDTNITEALAEIEGVSSTADQMEDNANDAELKNLQVSGIVAGTELKSKIGEANSIIQTINNKKEEVNGIVEEMKKHSTNPPTDLIESINKLLQRVDVELSNATGALDNATKVKTEITQEKDTADAALTKVQQATSVTNAQQEVATVKRSVGKVKELLPQVKSALATAQKSVTNANVLKKELETSLSKVTSEQNAGEVKGTEKPDPPVGDGTGTDQKDAMKQPTITNTEQKTSTDSPDQIDNSADKLKDKLIKGAHNVPTTALTGGKAPAPGAKNDSAMTVSVPLLVALIASAVWQ